MISETENALQELDETVYWLEWLAESGTAKAEPPPDLLQEADELTAIPMTGVKTLKSRQHHDTPFIIPRPSFIIAKNWITACPSNKPDREGKANDLDTVISKCTGRLHTERRWRARSGPRVLHTV